MLTLGFTVTFVIVGCTEGDNVGEDVTGLTDGEFVGSSVVGVALEMGEIKRKRGKHRKAIRVMRNYINLFSAVNAPKAASLMMTMMI